MNQEKNTYITFGDLETKLTHIRNYVEDDICKRLLPITEALSRNERLHEEISRNYNAVLIKLTSIDNMSEDIREIKNKLKNWEDIFVARKEFSLVQRIVYGAVGFILFSALSSVGAAVVFFLSNKV